MISLYCEPGVVFSWKDFCEQKPPMSIALDGYVDAPPKKDLNGLYVNFDHHSRVDRIATRSTCAQVNLEINMGLFKSFQVGGIPTAHVYVNDCDEDVCLAVWQLRHSEVVVNGGSAPINRLVGYEDLLDVTGGAFPFGNTQARRQLAWVFEPYTRARFEGRLRGIDSYGMETIIEAVGSRISKVVDGIGAEECSLEGQYERIGGGENWALITETGPAARMALFNDGVTSFISLLSENDGRFRYTICKTSVWEKFNVPKAIKLLNKAEGVDVTDTNRWGPSGSMTLIGGSPRHTDSSLSPEVVQEILAKV